MIHRQIVTMSVLNNCSFKRIIRRSPVQTFALIVFVTVLCLCIFSFTRFDSLQRMKFLADQQMFVTEATRYKQDYKKPHLFEITKHSTLKSTEHETATIERINATEAGMKIMQEKGRDYQNHFIVSEGHAHGKNKRKEIMGLKKTSHKEEEKDKGYILQFKEATYSKPIRKESDILPKLKLRGKLSPSNHQKSRSEKAPKEKIEGTTMHQISMEEALSRYRLKASKECINECPKEKDNNPFAYSSICNFTTQARWSYSLQQAGAELTPFLEKKEYVYPYEREYLSFPKIRDSSYLPSSKKSQVMFKATKNSGGISTVTCRLGEIVTARLDLVDRAGRPRTSGRDEIRVWVGATHAYNGSRINSMYPRSMAPVTDLNNGSYRIDVKCLWAGKSRLIITLRYPREFLRMVVEYVREGGSRFLGARFEKGAATEVVPCLATPNVPGRPCICNMTKLNGGAPFYCARPLDSRLTCNDWIVSGTMTRTTPSDFVAAEGKFAMKRQESLIPTDHLVIITEPETSHNSEQIRNRPIVKEKEGKEDNESDNQKPRLFMPAASEPCKGNNPKLTWRRIRPTGYWLDSSHTWVSLLCKETPLTKPFMRACLKDSSVWIIGDSNGVRLYYQVADSTGLARLDYGPMPFFDALARSNRQWNIKVEFSPHEHPLYVTKDWKQLDVDFMGVHDKIDAIPSKGRQFLIIHYFLHLTPVHLGVAHGRLIAARDAIIRLLARNSQAVVAIRGPHTVSLNADYDIAIGGDSLARHLIDIIREVFQNLQDRVLFLDGWETSLSVESFGIHPMGPVAEEMIKKFFSFACDQVMIDEI